MSHFGNQEIVNNVSGWLGDASHATEAKPTMGNDDYRADLDAVNTAKRTKNGSPFIKSYTEYYQGLDKVILIELKNLKLIIASRMLSNKLLTMILPVVIKLVT